MTGKPLVSIGMPVYNGERYVRRTLDSLLAQDYGNFELIISDNASTDKTQQICRDYEFKDTRVRVFVNEHNIGMMENFAAVLERAQGPYFMWAAADDHWLPQFVSAMVSELEAHPEAGVAMCAIERVRQDGTLYDTIRFCGEDDPDQMSYCQMAAKLLSPKKYNLFLYGLFRTTLLRQAMPLYPFGVPAHDRWFICQIALATHFRYVDRVLHVRSVHEASFLLRYPEEKFSRMRIEDKWADFKVLLALGQMLYQSPVIPWYRKAYIPVIMFRYVWGLLLPRFWIPFWLLIRPYCPPGVRKQLRRVKVMLASR